MKTAIFLVILALIFAGCVQQQNQTGLYTPPQGAPAVDIISPSDGEVINASSVGIWINVTNFRLAAIDINRPNRENEGHLHVYLDGVEKMSSLNNVAFQDVAAGSHVVRVELRKNDHSQLLPPKADEVRFTTVR